MSFRNNWAIMHNYHAKKQKEEDALFKKILFIGGLIFLLIVVYLVTNPDIGKNGQLVESGKTNATVAFPAYIVGEPQWLSDDIAIIGVQVSEYPNIKNAILIDCPDNCSNAIKLWRETKMKATVSTQEIKFQEGQSTTVWFVRLEKPPK